MWTYFKTETGVVQNLIDDFFYLTLTVRGPFYRKDFTLKKIWGYGLFSEKTEPLYAELNERAEAATSSYSATNNVLQYIYSSFAAKNHQKIRSRSLVHEFSFRYFLTILIMVTELLPFYKAVAAHCYYEKVRRTMCTAIVSYLLIVPP